MGKRLIFSLFSTSRNSFFSHACLLVLSLAIPLLALEKQPPVLLNPLLGNDFESILKFDLNFRSKMRTNLIHPRHYDISVLSGLASYKMKFHRKQVLIQTSKHGRSQTKQDVEAFLGSRVYRYIPTDTYIVEASEREILELNKIQGVVGVRDIPSIIKFSDAILEQLDAATPKSPTHDKFDHTFDGCSQFDGTQCKIYSIQLSRMEGSSFIEGVAHVMRPLKGVALLRALSPSSAIVLLEVMEDYSGVILHWLSSLAEVKWIGPFSERKLRVMRNELDPRTKRDTTLRNVYVVEQILGLPRSQIASLSGKGQRVAVTDTGIDYGHCFFYDPNNRVDVCVESETSTCSFQGSTNRKIFSYTVMQDAVVGDVVDGHGTHVCGIVAGNADGQPNSEFVTIQNGVAPDAKLVFQDGGGSQASDSLSVPQDLERYVYSTAYGEGARVHSNSWGGDVNQYTMDAFNTDDFIHSNPDYVVAFAAGNSGPDPATVTDPAVAKNIISVGASQGLAESGLFTQSIGQVLVLYEGNAYVMDMSPALFGPPIYRTYSVKGDLVAAEPADACSQLENPESLADKFVLVRRGSCTFSQKSAFVQNTSAIGMIVYNNDSTRSDLTISMAPADKFQPKIPCLMISFNDGKALNNILNQDSNSLAIELPSISMLRMDVASFSSRGPTYDGRFKPDLLAPGSQVISARSKGELNQTYCGLDALIDMSGTSMAAPAVAGAAALLREFFTAGHSSADGLTSWQHAPQPFNPCAALIRAMLLHSANHIGRESGRLTPSEDQGYGLINLSSVLRMDNSTEYVLRVQDGVNVSQGQVISVCIDVKESSELRVTIAWTDPPAHPSAFRALINDVDLTVVGPEGVTMYGNGKQFHNSLYGTYNVRDRLNNNEQVVWTKPKNGTYLLYVSGRDIPVNPQTVSMVVTGNFVVKGSCPPPSCPSGCKGAGECEGIYCHCDLYHMGEACELSTTPLDSAHADWVDLEPGESTFLYFNVSSFNQSWRLVINPADSAARFSVMLAIHKKPSYADHDLLLRHVSGDTEITSSSFSFSTQGVWVLAIHASLFNQFAASVYLETSPGGHGDQIPASTSSASSTTSSIETITTTTAAATPSPSAPKTVVTFQAQMPLSLADFQQKQSLFLAAVANTAGVPQRDVRIVKVTETQSASSPVSRRLSTSSSNVVIMTSITLPTVSTANQVVSKITMSKLNDNLQKQGLPRAIIVQAPYIESSAPASSTASTTPPATSATFPYTAWIAIGCGVAFLSLAVLAVVVHMRRKRAAELADNVVHSARSQPGDVEMQSYNLATTHGIITMPIPTAPPLLAVNADNVYIEEEETSDAAATASAHPERRFRPLAMAASNEDDDSCGKRK